MKVVHFGSSSEFRVWLEANHSSAEELWVAYYNKASGRAGLTYAESVDEALCFGWIDGIRRKVDIHRYTNRFTPRKRRSIWSLINVGHVERLTGAGRMHPAGLKAYAERDPKRTGIYSFEQRPKKLPAALERIFRANASAWSHWREQPPGYRRTISFWVASAVREETRRKRLAKLIAAAAKGKRLGVLG